MSNGASGRASRMPQRVEVVDAERERDDADADQRRRDQVDLDRRVPGQPRSQKLRTKTATARTSTTTKTCRQPTRVASVPPMRNALTPASARADPSEPIAVACWRAAVVLGDQGDERRAR